MTRKEMKMKWNPASYCIHLFNGLLASFFQLFLFQFRQVTPCMVADKILMTRNKRLGKDDPYIIFNGM